MRKVFACLFTALGLLILLGTGLLCFRSLHAPAKLLGPAETAESRTEALAAAVTAGDYAAAGDLMYGQPELVPVRAPSYQVGEILWEAYQECLELEFYGECRAADSGVVREATVTVLDITAVMQRVREQIDPVLDARAEAAVDKDLIFDQNNAYREAFVMETLCDVTRMVLETERPVLRRSVTLELVFEDGQWWILPEQELIRLLAGVPGKGV